ncbi:MAG: hypothetical protein ACTHQM_09975 [Thermoanaerobaculia bacterium]
MFLLALFLFAQEPCLDDVLERGWSAHIEHRFGEVRGEVEQRLASANDAEAYELACLYAMGIDDQNTLDPSQDLIDFFETSFGVRREEAAIQIASHGHSELSSELRTRVIDALRDRLLDDEAPPVHRGRAIAAVQYFATDDARLTETLLALSMPQRWFGGVEGAHYDESSVVSVIAALGSRRASPAVVQRLALIDDDIAKSDLSDFDQWLARVALEIIREH